MIISHKHKFIFIKTNKTAGTSIEIALAKFCGPKDIITPITPVDEALREKLGFRGPQNYLAPICSYKFNDLKSLFFKGGKKPLFFNHISAVEVISIIGKKTWDSYFTFCFERDPVDRFISFYYWRNRHKKYKSIRDFIESNLPNVLKQWGYNLYSENDKILVDHIGKYENLRNELIYLEKKLDLPEAIDLPVTKSEFRPRTLKHEDILTKEEIHWIKKKFSKEIKLFNY